MMSLYAVAPAARWRRLLALASQAAAVSLTAFHVWLFWAHLLSGRLSDPEVATRWVVGSGLFASLVVLRRLGVPVLLGRRAAVVWTLVAVLHCHAAVTTPDRQDEHSAAAVAVLVIPVTLGSASLGLTWLLWGAVPRRGSTRPRPSRWLVAPTAPCGVATAFHVLTLAPRPPPAR